MPLTEECPTILSEAGITETFAPNVAHTIHSLTLEDIRYFFKEDATEDNGIPTGNYTFHLHEAYEVKAINHRLCLTNITLTIYSSQMLKHIIAINSTLRSSQTLIFS